ncbi:MAG: MFS transporter [Pseudolabrys sp.]
MPSSCSRVRCHALDRSGDPADRARAECRSANAALLSTAFSLPYALVQPLLGALADMFSKARLMLLCLFVLASATIVCAMAPSFEVLVIGRIVAGSRPAAWWPISFALIGDKVPVAQRQVAMGRLLFAIMTGNLLARLAPASSAI